MLPSHDNMQIRSKNGHINLFFQTLHPHSLKSGLDRNTGWGSNQRGEKGIHKTRETREEARRLESTCRSPGNEPRTPGKEAEMKGRSS